MNGNGAPPPYLLLVDDEPDLAEAMHDYFELSGFEVVCAANAALALAAAAQRAPDAILTDLNLPDVSGLELATALRGACPSARLFVHSGDTLFTPGDAWKALGVTPDQVFYKPSNLGALVRAVRSSFLL